MPRSTAPSFHLLDGITQPLAAAIAKLERLPLRLWRRHCDRRRISRLLERGPRLVRDIGMTVEGAEDEAREPFWRSPYLPQLRPF